MATRSQAREHRRTLNLLIRQAHLDLRILFNRHNDPDRLRDTLLEGLPVMVDMYGTAAGTLAADFYDDLRDDEDIGGRYRATPAELPDSGRAETLARWGVGAAFAGDLLTAFSNTAGGLQRVIADAGAKQLGAVPWLAETEVGLELLGLDAQQIRRAMAEKRRLGGSAILAAAAAAAEARVNDGDPLAG